MIILKLSSEWYTPKKRLKAAAPDEETRAFWDDDPQLQFNVRKSMVKKQTFECTFE
jgi:hypothetical protein